MRVAKSEPNQATEKQQMIDHKAVEIIFNSTPNQQ